MTDLGDLDPTPLAGPTHMTQAHANGMRKASAIVKPWLDTAHQKNAGETVKRLLRAYLEEWVSMYGQGVEANGLTVTERSVIFVRRDTVAQILKELG